ncbi:polymer-forming cytoskeletal protein [Defluviimonas aestuarii]|uniref:bactofilin family protein n=1 Tax=Albidovulum aestuarii TaxID=1130726 RepID=UPI00249B04FE|nr:polymer-forming cytoskeletal protein [Defluviimonas aestuarii]MDI3336512.1 polymer-forming cytoskeletal protein [Defluviimonas aestuarii]
MTRSVIEEDLTIEGNITSKEGEIDVKGKVTGDVDARAVDIHPSGRVDGAISAETVNIQGVQSGRIKCTELSLEKSSDVKAEVTARTLISEKGARLVGKVQISGN